MRPLALLLLRAGGWVRPVLVGACTAVATALLLVALTMLLLPDAPRERLFDVVAQPGTRGGAAFGAAIMTVPLVLLLHQALRLGQAAREQRLAGLRLAGATPREVRRLGALEVACPAAVGSVLGVGLFWLLRAVIGGSSSDDPSLVSVGDYAYAVGLVPTSVTPSWWMFLLLLLAVVGGATALGLRVGRRVVLTPHGLVRQQGGSEPRPWGLAVLALSAVSAGLVAAVDPSIDTVPIFVALVLALVGLVMLAPWTAYVLGRVVQDRMTDVGALLAARRLVFEPGPAGRAGAAIGGIGLACGVMGSLLGDAIADQSAEFYFVASLLLVGACLLLALVVVSLSLAVHSAETLVDRRRSMASLHALGVPASVIRDSQWWEAALVAVPMSTLGAVLGALSMSVLAAPGPIALATTLLGVVATPLLSLVAVRLAVALTRPVTRRVVDAEHLRTA